MRYIFFSLIFFFASAFILNQAVAVPKTNPDISVNLLLLGKKSFSAEEHHDGENREKEDHAEEDHKKKEKNEEHEEYKVHNHAHNLGDGVSIQEVEFYFKSNIDPYFSGDISVGLSPHKGGFELDIEEAFVESLFIPSLTVRVGKFYALLGRHNNLHTHYYPFIDPPLINQTLFGFHGWNGTGASLAYLSPLPWYAELVAQGFYSQSEKERFSGILFFKNLWDLSNSSTLELNMSYGAGVKSFEHLYNAALVWKWKALESQRSLAWTVEVFQAVGDSSSENMGGLSSYAQWQFSKQWWLEGRAEYLPNSQWDDLKTQKYSVLLAYVLTEYSAIRLQYDAMEKDHGKWGHGVSIQTNMSLGTHPAHLY